jgi:glutathione synthase/RimK-type ligase-like ATP-grasp enzyme
MRECAFLTLDQRGDFVIDDECAVGPLAERGWNVTTLSWRQTDIPWSCFEAVVIRSTWDYWNDVPAFLEVLSRIHRETRLANPLDLVHWNPAKSYLRDLAGRGVDVVPTWWLNGLTDRTAEECSDHLQSRELVVKPVVGANGEDAFRFSRDEEPRRWAEITECFRGRACMVQPFMHRVQTEGEYSLFFFNGHFSHAILKVPAPDEFRSQEERGAQILAVSAEPGLLRSGERAMAAVRSRSLYARIDFVRNGSGGFDLMELELIEPSLYLRTEPEAPARFAEALDRWFGQASEAEQTG